MTISLQSHLLCGTYRYPYLSKQVVFSVVVAGRNSSFRTKPSINFYVFGVKIISIRYTAIIGNPDILF